MMKKVILFFLMLSPLILFSQSWLSGGDEWVSYQFPGFFVYHNGIYETKVVGEQLIAGEAYQVLNRRYTEHVLGRDTIWNREEKIFLRAEGDSLFQYDGEKMLIYDFSMEVGNSLEWQLEGCGTAIFTLDTLYTDTLNGKEFRVQEGQVEGEGYFFDPYVRIYEGIGVLSQKIGNSDWNSLGYILPKFGLTCYTDFVPPFLCSFRNDEFSFSRYEDCTDFYRLYKRWFQFDDKWAYTFGGQLSSATFVRELSVSVNLDTTINDIDYQGIKNMVVGLDNDGDFVRTEASPYFVREEDRRVYYWTGEEERLVYDFKMEVGDTIEWFPKQMEGENNENCKLYFVLDSLSINDTVVGTPQVQHGRAINLYWDEETEVEIYQGVGMVRYYHSVNDEWLRTGFLIPELNTACYFDEPSVGAFCSFDGFTLQFTEEEECYNLVSSVSQLTSSESLSINPNPATIQIFLEGADGEQFSYAIFSVTGEAVAKGQQNEPVINVSALNSGIYFLSVMKDEEVQVLKWVKN